MEYEIEVVDRQSEDTAVIRDRADHGAVGAFIATALQELLESLGTDPVDGPPFCRIEIDDEEFLLEVGFPVERPVEASGRIVASSLPGGLVATVMNVGPYDSVPAAYWAIEAWLGEHGYEPTGAPWESYLDGPEVPNPRTLVCMPCRRVVAAR